MPSARQGTIYASGKWEVDLTRRELRAAGRHIRIGGRAFEIIEVLVLSAGQLVTKDELIDRVWQGFIVEENALQAHISAIRKSLGADRELLQTVSRRGYRLLGTWTARDGGRSVGPSIDLDTEHPPLRSLGSNLAAPTSRLIGREIAVRQLQELVPANRAVTLTGTGGIGKTSLALEVARSLLPSFDGEGWFVELNALSDPSLIPSAVARILGLTPGGDVVSPAAIARAIGKMRLLLVIDNCEHLLEAITDLVETILKMCPNVSVLATSREVLRIEGEYVFRVPPLDVPASEMVERETIASHSAVQLFVARTTALNSQLSLNQQDFFAIADICRRLDGIPLAIEFAAARVATLGFQEVASCLSDRFSLLTAGRRTALRRHQTLRATLDWSHELLPDAEKTLLRRLAIFVGGFTLDAVTAVVNDAEVTRSKVAEGIASLVTKSLLVFDDTIPSGRWRFLETIRAYALEKLVESGEVRQVARRHAEFFRDLLDPLSGGELPSVEDTMCYAREIDNVRAALDWSFSPTGDTGIGLALTAAYCPIWLDLSLFVECRDRIECALGRLDAYLGLVPRLQMQLQITLGTALIVTLGSAQRANLALTTGLQLADRLENLPAQGRALWALWASHFNAGECRVAQSIAERFARVAARVEEPVVTAVARRCIGYTLQYMGRQREARASLEMAIELGRSSTRRRAFLYDQQLLARASLARTLWLQGFVDQAKDLAHNCLADAQSGEDKLAFCFVLGLAVCRIALMTGDLVEADQCAASLLDVATRQSFTQYVNVGRGLEAMLLVERGKFAAASSQLRKVLDTCDRTGWTMDYPEFLGTVAKGLAGLGQLEEGLTAIDQGLARAESGGARWYVPELLRIKGELLLQNGVGELIRAAEHFFEEAIGLAKEQGALFWELRAAMSLARLRARQGLHEEAHQVLAPVYDRITEGFETKDLRFARAILEEVTFRHASNQPG